MPRLFLIDSFGFIFRAYHARARSGAPPMRTAGGFSTEAVYIFHNMVRKLVNQFQPTHIAAVFESEGPTFRDEAFEAYKANRTETPPDLLEQIPWIRKTLDAMRIPVLEYPGFEADDVIGTLARKAVDAGFEVAIVSSDKDMLQLVNHHVRMLNPMKNDQWYDSDEVEKFMGVRPEQVIDLLALKGDTVDNIPGAPGIGEKGALDLIQRFGSVENAMEHAAEVQRKTYRESLQNNRDIILLNDLYSEEDTRFRDRQRRSDTYINFLNFEPWLRPLMRGFLLDKVAHGEFAPRTVIAMRSRLRLFAQFLHEESVAGPAEINELTMERYLAWGNARNAAGKTLKREMRAPFWEGANRKI